MLARDDFAESQPVSGSGAVYDLLRSLEPTEYYNSTCVAVGRTDTAAPADPVDPAPGAKQGAAELVLFIDQDHACPGLPGRERGHEPRRPAARDQPLTAAS